MAYTPPLGNAVDFTTTGEVITTIAGNECDFITYASAGVEATGLGQYSLAGQADANIGVSISGGDTYSLSGYGGVTVPLVAEGGGFYELSGGAVAQAGYPERRALGAGRYKLTGAAWDALGFVANGGAAYRLSGQAMGGRGVFAAGTGAYAVAGLGQGGIGRQSVGQGVYGLSGFGIAGHGRSAYGEGAYSLIGLSAVNFRQATVAVGAGRYDLAGRAAGEQPTPFNGYDVVFVTSKERVAYVLS